MSKVNIDYIIIESSYFMVEKIFELFIYLLILLCIAEMPGNGVYKKENVLLWPGRQGFF